MAMNGGPPPRTRPASILARARAERSIWTYNPLDGTYRDADGRKVSDDRLRAALGQYLDAQAQRARNTTADLASGYATVEEWEHEMRRIVKDTHGGAYMLGRGGRNAMRPADWGRIGAIVKQQYRYLNRYAGAVARGEVSAEQAITRSALYVGAARQAHGMGLQQARAWPDLPAQPGDGTSECLGHCRCWWAVVRTSDGWEATWNAIDDPVECKTCLERAEKWAPLTLPA
jgi:hypothetical protein